MQFDRPEAILIDLDGTLVDSVPDLAWAADRMMEELDLEAPGIERARNWVGNGVERFVKRALTGELEAEPEQDLYARGYEVFYRYYQQTNGKRSCLFPGIKEGLKALQAMNIKLGCVTNKAEAFTIPLLESLGVLPYFEVVVSGDTLEFKKPRPEPLWYGIEKLGSQPESAMMVGDSRHDVEAARNAGMRIVAVPYGYNHGEDVGLSNPDAVINSLEELPQLI